MTIYILLFILFLIPATQESLYKQKNYFFYFIIFLSSLLVAIRYQVGNDWENYVGYYQDIPDMFHLKLKDFNREFLFVLMVSLFKTIGFGYQILFFAFSIMTSGILLRGIYKFDRSCLFLSFFIFFCYHFIPYEMNTVRHGIATSWVFLAFYYSSQKDLKKYLLLIVIASMFQAFALVFIPFYWLNSLNLNLKTLILFVGGGLFVYASLDLMGIGLALPLFQSNIDYYLNDYYAGEEVVSYGISMGMLFNFILALYARFVIFKREYEESYKYRVIVNSLFFSFIVGLAFNSVGIFVERIVSVLNMTIILLLPMFMYRYKKGSRVLAFGFIVLFCILYYRAILYTAGPQGIGYQYIPYMYKL